MVESIQDDVNKEFSINLFDIVGNFYRTNEFELSRYQANCNKRDKELINLSLSEPLLSGVLSTAVNRDKNRTWSLVGGVRLVAEYGRKLHSFEDNDWRSFISKASTAFYSTNMGYAAEIGTTVDGVPVTAWNFDPTEIKINQELNNEIYPLVYKNKIGLYRFDFIRGNSMPSIIEKHKDIGFCAIERSVTMARIVIGLFEYHLEKLGVAPPKGLLLLTGMTRDQFIQAVQDAAAEAKGNGGVFYKNVLTILTGNTQADAKLVGFSDLPDQFNLRDFIEIVMQSYALAFNYPVGEFWSISSGSFGRTGEMKVQEQAATQKGELEFSLSLQHQLSQYFLPPSIYFSFDQRNDSGDLVKVEVDNARRTGILEMFKQKAITEEEVRILLAEAGFIKSEWTQSLDDTVDEELQQIRDKLLTNPNFVTRVARQPDEPIVVYTYSPLSEYSNFNYGQNITWDMARGLQNYIFPSYGHLSIIFKSGHDAIKRRVY